jgi:hypothetical protein
MEAHAGSHHGEFETASVASPETRPGVLFSRFGQVGSGLGKRVWQPLDGIEHQPQFVFAVIARVVLD